jgi:hypothetical protein
MATQRSGSASPDGIKGTQLPGIELISAYYFLPM